MCQNKFMGEWVNPIIGPKSQTNIPLTLLFGPPENYEKGSRGTCPICARRRLRVMDIDEVDLQQFFDMIDLDGSGSIEEACTKNDKR